MFKVKNLVLHLFMLKFRVTFIFTLNYIDKNSHVTKIFFKKSIELSLGKRFIKSGYFD